MEWVVEKRGETRTPRQHEKAEESTEGMSEGKIMKFMKQRLLFEVFRVRRWNGEQMTPLWSRIIKC
jgi:hypothetical protein